MASINELRRAGETERLQAIRTIVDDVACRLQEDELTESEARELVAAVRFQIRLLIPEQAARAEQMDTYDLIYGSRFERLIQQFIKCADN